MPQIRFTCHFVDVESDEPGLSGLLFAVRRRTEDVWNNWFEEIAAQCAKKICGKGVVSVISTGNISGGR